MIKPFPIVAGALVLILGSLPEQAHATEPTTGSTKSTGVSAAVSTQASTPASNKSGMDNTVSAATSTTVEVMRVLGRLREGDRVAGSAYSVSAETLERFDYDDVGRALVKVPGVYVRDEDGFGLRPNVGLRGTEADRSSRVVLLEDGILLGPAPYSAPAAYYVPLATRMVGLEVSKGPAAIEHGPNTVGGAINYLTAPIPVYGVEGLADVSAGQFGYMKGHFRAGYGAEHWGLLAEGVRVQSSGFKELDGGGDTGFEKNEVMLKGRVSSSLGRKWFEELEVKLGWSDEVSNETYLGLTEEDFRQNPYRRYRASALDQMVWERTQLEVSYRLEWDDILAAQLTAYRHDFSRAWFKLNTAGDPARAPSDFFAGTGQEGQVLEVIRGQNNGRADPQSATIDYPLQIGTNDRRFISQGVQLDGYWDSTIEGLLAHRLKFGARLHYDEVERDHTEATYEMVWNEVGFGNLFEEPNTFVTTLRNRQSALAFSTYLKSELTLWDWLTVTPGLRVEAIFSTSRRSAPSALVTTEDSYSVLIPGVGVYAQVLPELGAFAGVHRGFSPVAPGQTADIDVESSINYEFGGRFRKGGSAAEVVGFVSDYQNLLFTCTFGQGCPSAEIGQQENLGSIFVYGLEVLASQSVEITSDVSLDAALSYTFTHARLGDDFNSLEVTSPRYKEGEPGDPMPYRPEHQGALTLSSRFPLGPFWGEVAGSYVYVAEMQNEAGDPERLQAVLSQPFLTDEQHLFDVSAKVEFDNGGRVYLLVQNLFDEAYVASRAPFGARPGAPRFVRFGYAHTF